MSLSEMREHGGQRLSEYYHLKYQEKEVIVIIITLLLGYLTPWVPYSLVTLLLGYLTP